ncbi:MAG: 4Fe-4S binding protein [Cyanobacteriota bacterium]
MLQNLVFKIKRMSTIRKVVASIIFILFIWLLLQTKFEVLLDNSSYSNIFLKIDPLLILTTFISNRSFDFTLFLMCSFTILLTIIFGRFFCSWICPLGYLNQLISRVFHRNKTVEFSKYQYLKYYILLFIFILAIFGINIAGIFDPITLTIRSITIFILPAGSTIYNQVLDIVYNLPVLNYTYDNLKKVNDFIFASGSYNFKHFILMGIIFITILISNIFANRFWCNYLCPLGGLLGVISNISLFKILQKQELCKSCKICSKNCHGNANPHKLKELKYSECMVCGNCLKNCPQNGLEYKFNFESSTNNFTPERRNFIVSSVVSVLTVPVILKLTPVQNNLIRPPGAINETEFLNRCISCGECSKACPNNAIQITFLESGIEGIFTPFIIPRLSYCEYYCNVCSKVCPTSAIKEIKIEDRDFIAIGKAKINKKICIPYAKNDSCIVCEEHCPLPDKAIKVKIDNNIAKPYVDYDLCIGCGICEYKCPVKPDSAIKIEPKGATRLTI